MKNFITCILASLIGLALFQACSIKKVGKNFGEGLRESTDSIGIELIADLSHQLTQETTKEDLNQLLGAILSSLKDSLNQQILPDLEVDSLGFNLMRGLKNGLADPVLITEIKTLLDSISVGGQKSIDAWINRFTSIENKQKLSLLLSGLFSENLKKNLQIAVKGALDGALDSMLTDAGADRIRSQLLGKATRDSLLILLDSAMLTITARLDNNLSPAINKQLGFLQKWAMEIILLIGFIALGIIAFIWSQRTRYLKMTQMLTNQIDRIPDKAVYDELTNRIQKVAREHNFEKDLRQVLEENGMLGEKK